MATLTTSATQLLTPEQYVELQKQAPEALTLTLLEVQQTPQEDGSTAILMKAKVTGAKRSASRIKQNATIEIRYRHVPPGPGVAMSIPIIRQAEQVEAYLKLSADGSHYEPVARELSFATMPDPWNATNLDAGIQDLPDDKSPYQPREAFTLAEP